METIAKTETKLKTVGITLHLTMEEAAILRRIAQKNTTIPSLVARSEDIDYDKVFHFMTDLFHELVDAGATYEIS